MSSVAVIEYLNYVNEHGEAIGHGKKVLAEAVDLLKDGFEVHCVASPAYCPGGMVLDLELPCLNQAAGEATKGAILGQIKASLSAVKTDIVWFTNVDWVLLAYLAAFKPKGVKVAATLYRDYATDIAQSGSKVRYIKAGLVKIGIANIDVLIVANRTLKLVERQVFMPDYVYTDKYDAYRVDESCKKDQVVCVGSMRASKDLRGVLRAFADTGMPVKIIGSFSDKEELAWLREHATSNFEIEDRKLDDDEYYGLIGSSRYAILPYKMVDYRSATSGILQECLFLGTTPIAPRTLLEFNDVAGVGYERIDDLAQSGSLKLGQRQDPLKLADYDQENVKKKLMSAFKADV